MTREEIIDFCEMKAELEPENEDIFNYIAKTIDKEQFINKPCVSAGVCEHDKLQLLDRIKADIEKQLYGFMDSKDYDDGVRFGLMLAYKIIKKYKKESSDNMFLCERDLSKECKGNYKGCTDCVLDNIREDINYLHNGCGLFNDGVDASLKLIDKYKAEMESRND